MTNKEISSVFKLLYNLMELHGENSFKAKTYSNAAFQMGRVGKPMAKMTAEELAAVPGIGKAVHEKVLSLLQSGSFKLLDELVAKTPEGMFDLFRIKGLGPKKLKLVWEQLGIESIGELSYACNENRLVDIKGFGIKTQTDIINQIAFLQVNQDKFIYALAESTAEELVDQLMTELNTELVCPVGELRRKSEILESIDILIGEEIEINQLENIISGSNQEDEYIKGQSSNGFPVHIYSSNPDDFEKRLFELTGSAEHIEALESKGEIIGETEEEIYENLGMPYILPELREGLWALDAIPEELIEVSELKGSVHNHSTYSDGRDSLEDMANACIELGYEYLVISDHSKTAVYANGLNEDRVFQQQKEIDKLNENLSPFKIFKSIESDILYDGSLDYDTDVLKTFDLVIASVHAQLKMEESKAMERLLKAIENPYTRILGHMTGRLLLNRKGYPVDHKKIIDACAANNVAIELNANPLRLDMDWRYIPYAMEKGVLISINPDAHHVEGLHDVHFGTLAARKGGLNAEACLNAKNLADFEKWIANK